jgi:HAD superfamily hydrolase (TIGR01509 family)
MDSKQLAHLIKTARKNANLTQDDLSDKAGLSYSTLAKIEQGAIKSPSVFTMLASANGLDLTLDQLLNPAVVVEALPPDTAIRFVYIDMNGVLVRFFHHAFVSLSEEIDVPFDRVETTFWHYNDPANRGEITLGEFNRHMAHHLGVPGLNWERHYMRSVKPITEMWSCLKRLHARYQIGLLTNTMPGFIEKMQHRQLLPDFTFDTVVDSSVVGAVKPEDDIYRAAENAAGFKGAEIFFIDDSRANLTAAEQFGWRVMWFDDYNPPESVKRIEETLL